MLKSKGQARVASLYLRFMRYFIILVKGGALDRLLNRVALFPLGSAHIMNIRYSVHDFIACHKFGLPRVDLKFLSLGVVRNGLSHKVLSHGPVSEAEDWRVLTLFVDIVRVKIHPLSEDWFLPNIDFARHLLLLLLSLLADLATVTQLKPIRVHLTSLVTLAGALVDLHLTLHFLPLLVLTHLKRGLVLLLEGRRAPVILTALLSGKILDVLGLSGEAVFSL